MNTKQWKIHKSKSADFVVRDEDIKLKLSRAMQAIQNDQDIVSTIADSLEHGSESIAIQ